MPLLPDGAQTAVIRDVPARSWGTGYTRVISASIVNEARFAYNYVGLDQDSTLPKDEIIPNPSRPSVESGIPTSTSPATPVSVRLRMITATFAVIEGIARLQPVG